MSRPLHVLVVEDSEEDTLLLMRELRQGDFDPTLARVETPETMRSALVEQPWDLVIADYTMPHFSGTEALELLRKSGVDAPFIFLSGTLGEEKAVAAMKVGAHDYIMKGNLKRLVPVIERELRESEVRKQRKRAEEQIRRQQERMRILHEINLAITSTLDLKSILELLLEKIDFVLPFPTATTIRLFSKETGRLDPVACRNIDETEWKGDPWSASRGVSQLVFDSMGPMLIHNIQTNPRIENKDFYRQQGLVSYLGVPLVAKGHSLGVIGFYTKEDHAFTPEEIDFLSALAGQAAIAIQNSQLYEQTKTAKVQLESTNQRLERSLKELSGLYTALTPLAPADSITRMMDRIIDRLIETTGADAALIRLREDISGTYPCVAQRGFPDYYLKTVVRPPPAGAVAWVFQNAQPIIAADIAAEERLKGKIQLEAGLRSCAMLPLLVQNEVRGILHLASRELGYFNLEQEHHLMAIARQMGIALENRDLFDEIKASRDELEKANRVKSEFLSVMSHELRTPLTSVMGYTALIQEGLITGAGQTRGLQKVMKHANELLDMINNILQATSLEAKKTTAGTDDVHLSRLLDDLRLGYDFPLEKELTLRWDYASDLPVIRTDSGKLKQILQNLINNAIKFTEKGSVTVSARVLPAPPFHPFSDSKTERDGEPWSPVVGHPSFLEFKVADTGIGISKDSLPIIFEMFRQADSSETRLYGGVGLGLYIVKKFTVLLGGTVRVESKKGEGSSFRVTLPLRLSEPLSV